MQNINTLYKQHKEIILYIIFGILTTLINFIIYFSLTKGLNINYILANSLSWIGAVIFAFFTNKIYVFKAKNTNISQITKEFFLFTSSRFLSFLIETSLLFLGVEIVRLNDSIVKILVSILVVVINYFFTKFIFKKNKISHKRSYKIHLTPSYIFVFTLVFLVMSFFIFLPFILKGSSFIWAKTYAGSDGLSQHYYSAVYIGQYLREAFKTIFVNHSFNLKTFDNTIGFGQDVITTLNYYVLGDPLSILYAFVSKSNTVYMYNFLILFRIYLSGILFSIYAFKMKQNKYSAFIGSFIYMFSGYTIYLGIRHPFFINPMIYLPLYLISIEKIFKDKSYYLFVITTTISAMSNFYFFFANTVFIIAYCIIRIFYLYKNSDGFIKIFFNYFLKIAGYYILGILLSSIIFLPSILGFLSCARTLDNKTFDLLCYEIPYYIDVFTGFMKYKYLGGNIAIGIGIIPFMCIFSLFLEKGKKEKYLKILFIAFLVMSLIPLFSLMFNGGTHIKNRWSYAFIFLISFISSYEIEKLFSLNNKKKFFVITINFLYFIFVSVAFIIQINASKTISLSITYIILIFIILGSILLLIKFKNMNSIFVLSIILCISQISISGFLTYSHLGSNYVKDFKSYNNVDKSINYKEIKYIKSLDPNTSNYRIDGNKSFTLNYGISNNIPGVSAYYSVQNKEMTLYNRSVGNAKAHNNSIIDSFNNRTILNTLGNVKYIILNNTRRDPMPYGYKKIKTFKNNTVYKNIFNLNKIYTYSYQINNKEYSKLSLLDKEESALQEVNLKNRKNKNVNILKNTKLKSNDTTIVNKDNCKKQMIASIKDNNGSFINNNKIYIAKKNTIITISLPRNNNNKETFICFNRLNYDYQDKEKSIKSKLFNYKISKSEITIKAMGENKDVISSTTIPIYTKSNSYYSGTINSCINLGYNKQNIEKITIKLSKPGIYSFDNIQVASRDFVNYQSYVNKLNEDKVENINIDNNIINADITTNEEKIAVIATPYSTGWKAFINGKETEVYKANEMYMGIKLIKGVNHITFKYETPGLKLGALISLIALIFSLALMVVKGYKKTK